MPSPRAKYCLQLHPGTYLCTIEPSRYAFPGTLATTTTTNDRGLSLPLTLARAMVLQRMYGGQIGYRQPLG